ncbi:MAG: type ISP restriction/modification enzyme [Anaerolineae bacterium]
MENSVLARSNDRQLTIFYVTRCNQFSSTSTPNAQQQIRRWFNSEWEAGEGGRVPNLSVKFVREMEAKLNIKFKATPPINDDQFSPEDVFHYAYAVFHSPTYRERYAEFLKIDFPRLPLTSDVALFRALCLKGQTLVNAHLLKNIARRDLVTSYPERGSNVVEQTPKFDKGRVYINKTQYFEGISEEVWNFYVGGYQVMEKWLKDRKGRTLTDDDILHYQKIVVALQKTIMTMAEIDEAIGEFPIR